MNAPAITDATAREWARTITQVVTLEFPAAAHHVSAGPADTDCTPSRLHPAFWGSFDWHSCVHMLATGVKLLAWDLGAVRGELLSLLDARLHPTAIAAEAAYLRDHPLYERPYGWAWALHLGKTCRDMAGRVPEAGAWAAALEPLEAQIAENATAWLAAQPMPVRHGVHDNSALTLYLFHEALPAGHPLCEQVESKARAWFGSDADYPFAWELSSHDFVSNGLAEAVLMQRVLEPGEFEGWLAGFFPERREASAFYSQVLDVPDARDGKLAHLHGLALTRAWMLRLLAAHMPVAEPGALVRSAREHLSGDNFMATHWLITYALLAETAIR